MPKLRTAALLSGLAALASTQSTTAGPTPMVRLAPHQVPTECATICGPVVELTDICHVGSHDDFFFFRPRVKRRKIRRRQAVVTNAFGQVVRLPEQSVSERVVTVTSVITLTATPSPVPGQVQGGIVTTPGSEIVTSSVWTTTMTMAMPNAVQGGLVLPTDDVGAGPAATTTPLAVGNVASGDDWAFEYAEEDGFDWEQFEAVEEIERDCTCGNDSFDVALVSGLCASCIVQTGRKGRTIKQLLSQCEFEEREYDPNTSDSVVTNLIVRATRPTLPEGIDPRLISESPPSPRQQTGFLGAVAAGVACGVAMLL